MMSVVSISSSAVLFGGRPRAAASSSSSSNAGASRRAAAPLKAVRASAPVGLGLVATGLASRSGAAQRSSRRGALVVRNDGIDEAAELSIAGPSTAVGPGASAVVPKLPRSSCTRTIAAEEGFNLATTSFGTIGLSVGVPLLLYGFFGYFKFLPGGSITSLLLIYGFIISLIGFALKYAQLDPLECITYEDALALRWAVQQHPIFIHLRFPPRLIFFFFQSRGIGGHVRS